MTSWTHNQANNRHSEADRQTYKHARHRQTDRQTDRKTNMPDTDTQTADIHKYKYAKHRQTNRQTDLYKYEHVRHRQTDIQTCQTQTNMADMDRQTTDIQKCIVTPHIEIRNNIKQAHTTHSTYPIYHVVVLINTSSSCTQQEEATQPSLSIKMHLFTDLLVPVSVSGMVYAVGTLLAACEMNQKGRNEEGEVMI